MASSHTVTVGVPVYQGELYVEEALRSVQRQTHEDFEVIISLDGPQPEAQELCRPFLHDPRFRLVTQPERLGWVGNINWLMAQVATPYWCYHQQDDLLDPRCFEVLVDHARHAPEGAVFFADIEAFGSLSAKFSQSSVTGSATARQLALVFEHYPAVAFRGLTRVEALRFAGAIPPNEVDSFACDTVWMAAMARSGELRRVPVELFRKRYHTGSEHMKWFSWPIEKRTKAWVVHCAAMLRQAMLVEATAQQRRLLWLAAVGRLVSSHAAHTYLPLASWSAAERASLLHAFYEYVTTATSIDLPALLEGSWTEIQRWTTGFSGLAAEE
jgi:hypothetical protein